MTHPLVCRAVKELSASEVGHERRRAAVKKVARALSAKPSQSFPTMMSASELECAYRLFSHAHLEHETLLSGHVEASAKRCRVQQDVVVIHDSTEMAFSKSTERLRSGFAKMSANRQGFWMHTSLAACAASGLPLGVLRAHPYVHRSSVDESSESYWQAHGGLYENEQTRWFESAKHSEAAIGEGACILHLMDSEGDAYQTLARMNEASMRYIVRAQQDARCTLEGNLSEVLSSSHVLGTRTLQVSARVRDPNKGKQNKRNPAREARRAKVEVRACEVSLKRTNTLDASWPEPLRLHVVQVHEVEPPEGQTPVHWTLFTTEPIGSVEQVWRVVDGYVRRWVIEEYFQALKSGCLAEARQLDSIEAYMNFLMFALPVAVRMLQLRTWARLQVPHVQGILSKQQQQYLAAHPRCRLPSEPSAQDYLWAVAALGGHLKHNGSPGWKTLYRGFERLAAMEEDRLVLQSILRTKDLH